MATRFIFLCLLLAALTAALPCPTNPVISIIDTNEGTCTEGSITVGGGLNVDFDVTLGANATTSTVVTGVLYSDDVTAVTGDLTVVAQNASHHVIAKMGHTWNGLGETDTGQFEVQDSAGTPAFVVNNWGAAVFKAGVLLESTFRDVAGDGGDAPLENGRLLAGYTFYRIIAGDPTFKVLLPTANEFEEMTGTLGVATTLGVRFPPIYMINKSGNAMLFATNTGVTMMTAPATFSACVGNGFCEVTVTTVASSVGAVTVLVQSQTTMLI